MVAYDDTVGGSCPKCTVEDAEAPIPSGGGARGGSGATPGTGHDEDDERRKKKQIVGSTMIPPGLALMGWGWRDALKHCLHETGRMPLPDWIFVPTIDCTHALLRIATGVGIAGAGVTPFFTPPDKDDKRDKCRNRTATQKKKSADANRCRVVA